MRELQLESNGGQHADSSASQPAVPGAPAVDVSISDQSVPTLHGNQEVWRRLQRLRSRTKVCKFVERLVPDPICVHGNDPVIFFIVKIADGVQRLQQGALHSGRPLAAVGVCPTFLWPPSKRLPSNPAASEQLASSCLRRCVRAASDLGWVSFRLLRPD